MQEEPLINPASHKTHWMSWVEQGSSAICGLWCFVLISIIVLFGPLVRYRFLSCKVGLKNWHIINGTDLQVPFAKSFFLLKQRQKN